MKIAFEAICDCGYNMNLVDTTEYDDTFYCHNCKKTIEVRPRK